MGWQREREESRCSLYVIILHVTKNEFTSTMILFDDLKAVHFMDFGVYIIHENPS